MMTSVPDGVGITGIHVARDQEKPRNGSVHDREEIIDQRLHAGGKNRVLSRRSFRFFWGRGG